MKITLVGLGVALLLGCAGCEVESGYGGAYGGVEDYPPAYYGSAPAPAPVYVEPYPYVYPAPYDRDHYWDRRHYWDRHRYHHWD